MKVFDREVTTPQVIVFAVTTVGIFIFGTFLTGARGFPMEYIELPVPGGDPRFHSVAFLVDVAFAGVLGSLVFWVRKSP